MNTRLRTPRRPPIATYRIQLTPEQGFDAAATHVAHVADLGASHLYLSPIAEAVPGSAHGYDVTDPTRVRAELGGREAFARLCDAADASGLGVIVDIVPNHMAAHGANPWWNDVLKRGRFSEHASMFDIDWSAGDGEVVLPVLGASLDEVVARGEIEVAADSAGFALTYFGQRFPIAPGTLDPERIEGPAALHELLERQAYRLVHWRAGARARNYRRFFDIDALIAVRVEDAAVFDRTHRLIKRLWRDGRIDGVRVDHVDGLTRPGRYLDRLRAALPPRRDGEAIILVEKILANDERLPPCWPVEGTTGYETLNEITRVFVDRRTLDTFEVCAEAAGLASTDFRRTVRSSKERVMRDLFPGELDALAQHLADAQPGDVAFDRDDARAAIAEMTLGLDVYRTYFADGTSWPVDALRVEAALRRASPRLTPSGLAAAQAIVECLQGSGVGCPNGFTERYEQFTGPVMAKGLEDTALYRHAVLLALDEVGGEPDLAHADPATEFHAAMAERAAAGGAPLTPLSTHDTKLGEDTRAALLALASVPDEWCRVQAECVGRLDAELTPSDRIRIVQVARALLGDRTADPDDLPDRIAAYAVKASRESKQRTAWRSVDEAYEERLRAAARRAVAADFAARIRPSEGPLAEAAAWEPVVSLVQTVLRMTVPGVPDTYGGSERAHVVLVDPDNRAPLDGELLGSPGGPGYAKERLLRALHGLRRERLDLFLEGGYRAVAATLHGAPADARALAFERHGGGESILVAVPLHPSALDAKSISFGGESERAVREPWTDRTRPLWPAVVL